MLKKILVANRGEIAIRVMRACRELGIQTVAVYSEADRDALFAKYADEAIALERLLRKRATSNIKKIMDVAKESAQKPYTGIGFLAENPGFANACERDNIKFIGPSSNVIELMGNKIAARQEMAKAGIPVTPAHPIASGSSKMPGRWRLILVSPVIIKPSGGGAALA